MSESDNVVNINNEINWAEVVKKEARGIEDADFGEVQEIVLHYILTEKGLINKEKFYLPTDLVVGFDGEKLRFNISEEEAKEKFQMETAPSADEYAIYKKKIISMDIDTGKQYDKKNNADLSPGISPSKEVKDINQTKQETHHNTKGSPSQNKKSEIKTEFEYRETEERIRREVEDKAKQEAERKAQSIQDRAKQEAERKAQSIEQQAEDRAKQEAERRFNEIIQQAEDRAKQEAERKAQSIQDRAKQEAEFRAKTESNERFNTIREELEQKVRKEAAETARSIEQQAEDRAKQEAERRFNEIIQQAEDRAKQEFELKKELDQEKSRYSGTYDNNENNVFLNPFMTGINIWQNYSLLCMNITKEMLSNNRRMIKDFENTIRENQTNYSGLNNTLQKQNN